MKSWKRAEKVVAAIFGCRRRPLSGSNSGGDGCDDIIHPRLHVEVKYRVSHSVWTLYSRTKALAHKEGKIPVVALVQKYSKGQLIVIHSSDLVNVLKEIKQDDHLQNDQRPGKPGKPQEDLE